MKSNRQRRDEIKTKRLARAAKLAKDYTVRDVGVLKADRNVPGMVLADQGILARYNNTYGPLPRYYMDRAFTCRNCGAQEVWTAKQQKWWYEEVHGSIHSQAIRCLACRRARRAQLDGNKGANLLRQQTARLRVLGAEPPTAQARTEIEAALQSKWWGLRTVAIETLGRWGGPEQIAQLQILVAARAGPKYWGCWERVAADAASQALQK